MEYARLRSVIGGALALFLTLSIPARSAPPADSGRPVVYEGMVSVAVEDDFARGRATKRYFLDEQTLGERVELNVSEAQGRLLRTGARIRVRGVAAGGTLAADATADSVTVLADAVASVPVTARKAVVMLVDITDSTAVESRISADCDGAVAKSSSIMFGTAASVDACYKDSSYGALGMGGSVYPGGTLDVVRVSVTEAATTGGTCNYTAWGSAADKAAAAAGIVLGNYQHRVYVLPSNVGCSWAGLAYVGCGNSCQAWVKAYSGQACGYNDAYAHELGHNLGMWHASTDTNNDGTLDCEYCDNSDFMGYAMANLRTQNGPHKVQMGWASGARVVDGSQGGTFTISSLAQSAAASPQVVKVRPNSGDPYYVSFRTATGCDQSMPSSATYLNRTTVHRWSSGNTRYVASLADGETFSDATTGVSVKQLSRTADSATIQVSTVCAASAPTVTLSPSSQGAGSSLPATKSYTVTVTNRDSASCSTSTFSLASAVPAGWTGAITPASIALSPGASGTATASVTAPGGTAAGSYDVNGGTKADAAHAAVMASGKFWIDPLAPGAPGSVTATAKANRVTVSWTASTDTGGSGINRYEIRRGFTFVGTSTSTGYSDSPGNGTWTYSITAVDGAGNVSPATASNAVKVGRK
jgi:hypothetical protein